MTTILGAGNDFLGGKDLVIDLSDNITLKNISLAGLKTNPCDHFDVTKNIAG